MKLTTHLHLLPRSRMRGAIPSLLQYLMAWCSVEAQVHSYFYLYSYLVKILKLKHHMCSFHARVTRILFSTGIVPSVVTFLLSGVAHKKDSKCYISWIKERRNSSSV
jgi:hypothetical protein